MRQSAQLAAGGLRRCMQRTHPGLFEFQLAADFGAVAPSLPPSHSKKTHKKGREGTGVAARGGGGVRGTSPAPQGGACLVGQPTPPCAAPRLGFRVRVRVRGLHRG